MNELPFTSEQFFQVFRDYNEQVWPAQFALLAVAVAVVWCAQSGSRRGGRLGWSLLSALWLWCAVAYHWLHFAAVNPAAYGFGTLFLAQAVLLGWTALRGSTGAAFSGDAAGVAGAALMSCALVVYPLVGALTGHAYMASPTFGLPCPLTIFTFGVLLWARPHVPTYLLIIPLMWAVVGSSAFLAFGVWQDTLLPFAGLVAIGARLAQRRSTAGKRAAAA